MTSRSVQFIEEEQIKFLRFPQEDVLDQKVDQLHRFLDLKRAQTLGKFEKEKVKIFFVDDSSLKKVETTIYEITEKAVMIKQRIMIPMQRIISIV